MIFRRRGRFLVLLVCAWFYGTLLFLYPKSFRLRYSRELRRDFFGLSRAALREGGILGVLRVWAQAFSALVLTAIRRRRILPMEQRVAGAMVMIVQVAVVATVVTMVSLWQVPTYKATSMIWMTEKPGGSYAYIANYGGAAHAIRPPGIPEQLEAIRRATDSRPVAEEVIRRLDLRMDPAELLDNLAIKHRLWVDRGDWPQTDKDVLVFRTYKDTDPERARLISNMVGQVAFESSSSIGYEKVSVPENPVGHEPVSHPFRNGLLTLTIGLLLCLMLKRREFMYLLSNRGAAREATYYLWREGYAYYLSLGPTISAKATTAVGLFVAVALSVASMVGGKGLPKEIGE